MFCKDSTVDQEMLDKYGPELVDLDQANDVVYFRQCSKYKQQYKSGNPRPKTPPIIGYMHSNHMVDVNIDRANELN